MSTQEAQERLVDVLKRWQKLENAAVAASARIAEQTDHELVHLIMGVILRDSQTHYAVQQVIINTFEHEAMSIEPSDLGDVWDLIEAHIKTERQTVEMAREAIEALGGAGSVVARYLVDYLLIDEEKHNRMLEGLEKIKGGMHPYG